MIVITEVKYMNTDYDRDMVRIFHHQNPKLQVNALESPPYKIREEMIRGRRFVNAKREEICIGMSEEVQELIGLPFEVFENLQSNIEYEKKSNKQLNDIIIKYERMNLWGRVKNVFKKR